MGTIVPKRGAKIVVVDDERLVADTLAAILKRCGYEVEAYYSGEEALARCVTLWPDLLISDVVMPGLNGIQTAIRVRQAVPTCKILLFSGQAHLADLLEEATEAGHTFELLAKPLHPKDLLARITVILQ